MDGIHAEVYPRRRWPIAIPSGLWDWRIVASNGEIVATSGGQGFTERNDAADAVNRLVGMLEGGLRVEYVDR